MTRAGSARRVATAAARTAGADWSVLALPLRACSWQRVSWLVAHLVCENPHRMPMAVRPGSAVEPPYDS